MYICHYNPAYIGVIDISEPPTQPVVLLNSTSGIIKPTSITTNRNLGVIAWGDQGNSDQNPGSGTAKIYKLDEPDIKTVKEEMVSPLGFTFMKLAEDVELSIDQEDLLIFDKASSIEFHKTEDVEFATIELYRLGINESMPEVQVINNQCFRSPNGNRWYINRDRLPSIIHTEYFYYIITTANGLKYTGRVRIPPTRNDKTYQPSIIRII